MSMTIEESIDLVRTLYYTIPEKETNARKSLMKAWEGLEEFNAISHKRELSTDKMEQVSEPDIDAMGDIYSHRNTRTTSMSYGRSRA